MSRSCKLVLLFFALSILSISALAESPDKYTVNVSANKFLGNYLVNQSGFALYYFLDDADGNGASTCYEDCATTWPPSLQNNCSSRKPEICGLFNYNQNRWLKTDYIQGLAALFIFQGRRRRRHLRKWPKGPLACHRPNGIASAILGIRKHLVKDIG